MFETTRAHLFVCLSVSVCFCLFLSVCVHVSVRVCAVKFYPESKLLSFTRAYENEDRVKMSSVGKEDPVKTHREGTAYYDSENYKEARDKFLQASPLYEKVQDFFDASYTLFKAAECSFLLRDYETAMERFLGAADKALARGFDRFGPGALEYALDCYRASEKEEGKEAAKLKKRIAEVKKKLKAQAF
jgi:tetratricopeptide (TPR) repeat protein